MWSPYELMKDDKSEFIQAIQQKHKHISFKELHCEHKNANRRTFSISALSNTDVVLTKNFEVLCYLKYRSRYSEVLKCVNMYSSAYQSNWWGSDPKFEFWSEYLSEDERKI